MDIAIVDLVIVAAIIVMLALRAVHSMHLNFKQASSHEQSPVLPQHHPNRVLPVYIFQAQPRMCRDLIHSTANQRQSVTASSSLPCHAEEDSGILLLPSV